MQSGNLLAYQGIFNILVKNGSTKEMNLNFSSNKYFRHFSYANYSRKLKNGEISDRKWLVYCKYVDKVLFL
jgi:hypothetical protein